MKKVLLSWVLYTNPYSGKRREKTSVFDANMGDSMNGMGVEGEKREEHVELIY